MTNKRAFCIVMAGISIFLHGLLLAQTEIEPDVPEKKGKTIKALKANPHAPKVDGYLHDEIWQKAQAVSNFKQESPQNGKSPTEKTEVRVAFDAQALYVAVRAFDSAPNQISGRLDQRAEPDWITVAFDSRHDHQTAYSFGVNPAGVRIDRFLHNDTLADDSWNAKWEAKTQIDSLGWSAEFRIPLARFSFPAKKEQAWGFNVWRMIARKKEKIAWVHKPRKVSGEVSRFGHLSGIGKIETPARLQVSPHVISYAVFQEQSGPEDQHDFFRRFGADIKYKLNSGLSLEATTNPNADLIEADDIVLNLTAFETFLPNKKPFFVEGANYFNTRYRLFHARRISDRPNRYRVERGDQVLDRPRITTILGAAKLTGKTSNGISLGILDAVTANEYAKVTNTQDSTQQRLLAPMTNYFVARINKEVLKRTSTVGLMATAVNRRGAESAYTGGLDWSLNFRNKAYNFSGQMAGSYADGYVGSYSAVYSSVYAAPFAGRKFGYAADMSFTGKGSKWLGGNFKFQLESPTFQINDLGYLVRNNRISTSLGAQIRPSPLFKFIRHSVIDLDGRLGWNYDRQTIIKGITLSHSLEFTNEWRIDGGAGCEFRRVSDQDVFRGGALILQPPDFDWWLKLTSNRRKSLVISPNFGGGWNEHGSHSGYYRLAVDYNPSKSISFRISAGYNAATYAAQWIDNLDDNHDGRIEHYVYGTLETKVVDAAINGTMSVRKNLTLQVYVQPFIAVGKYTDFKELVRPLSFDFAPHSYGYKLDFNSKYLNSNIGLRWEFISNARLYLVWSQWRSDYSRRGDFRFGREVKSLFSANGIHAVLLKLDYGLGFL